MLTQEEYSEQLYTEDEILLRVKEAIVQAGMPMGCLSSRGTEDCSPC